MVQGRHEHNHDNHSADHEHGKKASAISAGTENWRRSQLPFGTKLRVSMRNTFTKLRNRSSCCGHPGEPGC
jgi:hypothetical protein